MKSVRYYEEEEEEDAVVEEAEAAAAAAAAQSSKTYLYPIYLPRYLYCITVQTLERTLIDHYRSYLPLPIIQLLAVT